MAEKELPTYGKKRPLSELSSSGMLYYINSAALHPRGVAMQLFYDAHGEPTGFAIVTSPNDEPWGFEDSPAIDDAFRAANRTIAEADIVRTRERKKDNG